MILKRLPVTKALRVMVADLTGKPCGKGVVPTDTQVVNGHEVRVPIAVPYTILYPFASAGYGGPPFATPQADATWSYQLTLVSRDGDQIEWLRDRFSEFFTRPPGGGSFVYPFELDGYGIMDRRLTDDGGDLDGIDSGAAILSLPLRFDLDVTPDLGDTQ